MMHKLNVSPPTKKIRACLCRTSCIQSLHCLRLDKILSGPDVIAIKGNSYSHLLQGGAHDSIIVPAARPLFHKDVVMDSAQTRKGVKGRLLPGVANILAPLGKGHSRVSHTRSRIGLTGLTRSVALVVIDAAFLRVRLQ